jgi:putative transposase
VSRKKSQLKSHSHCVFKISYHIVFVTKYRKNCLTHDMLIRLKEIFLEICERWDLDLLEFGGESDHVHLLIEAHPNIFLSRLINSMKTLSSRYIRKEFEVHLKTFYWKKPVLWTRAYCVLSAGGAPLAVLKKYIENQGKN